MTSDLTAYSDWHVTIDENEIWCAQPGCSACPGDGSVGIGSVYGLTARNLCKAIAAHNHCTRPARRSPVTVPPGELPSAHLLRPA